MGRRKEIKREGNSKHFRSYKCIYGRNVPNVLGVGDSAGGGEGRGGG